MRSTQKLGLCLLRFRPCSLLSMDDFKALLSSIIVHLVKSGELYFFCEAAGWTNAQQHRPDLMQTGLWPSQINGHEPINERPPHLKHLWKVLSTLSRELRIPLDHNASRLILLEKPIR